MTIHVQEKRTASYECYPGSPCLTAAETGLLHGYTCPNHRAEPGWIGEAPAPSHPTVEEGEAGTRS